LQVKAQWLPLSHVQVLLAHSPLQVELSPSQRTAQGGALQMKSQVSPVEQAQVPFWQSPVVR